MTPEPGELDLDGITDTLRLLRRLFPPPAPSLSGASADDGWCWPAEVQEAAERIDRAFCQVLGDA